MKKTLITIVLATFLLSMPVSSEGRENPSGIEIQAISTSILSNAPAFLQSIGIGRRRSVRRRRVRRHMVSRIIRRNRGRHLRRGVYMRRSVRGRRHPRTIGIPIIPRRIGIGVRRGRRRY
ncbi:MAG: hypothetical protein H0W99_05350 [Acidobacteria bacterium]|nr:hypothetical protein [Acidobacteriota bacterium]